MTRMVTKSLALFALVGAFTAFSTTKAEAALSLMISAYDSSNTLLDTETINDGDLDDNQGAGGAVGFSGAVGSWIINSHTGIGDPVFGDQPHLDLAYSTVGTGAAGEYLVVSLTQTDTDDYAPYIFMDLGGTNNQTTTSGALYADDGNGAFTLTDLVGSTGFGQSTVAFPAGYSGTYSLTQVLTITKLNAQGQTANASGDFEITGVPEPFSLSLLGLGLAGLAVRRRRKA